MKSEVTSRRREATHLCHWTGCNTKVPPAMWGCKRHWYQLPKAIRDEIWNTYVPGQEVSKTPSAAYIVAANKAREYIAERAFR